MPPQQLKDEQDKELKKRGLDVFEEVDEHTWPDKLKSLKDIFFKKI